MNATQDEYFEYHPLVVKNLDHEAPMRWLKAGWADFKNRPLFGLMYGLFFFVLSWTTVIFLFVTKMEWMLLPAAAGGILVGPVLAIGLYRESQKRIAASRGKDVRKLKINSTQVALIGAILMTLLLIWIRAAVIIYALFFGLTPFPGLQETITELFFTVNGLTMLAVGSAVGGLFAALVYAISAFSIPMLVDQDVDGFTAMGRSFVAVNRNFWVMIHWAAIIVALTGLSFLTLFVGMIVVFPVLGHATWHAYDEVFNSPAA